MKHLALPVICAAAIGLAMIQPAHAAQIEIATSGPVVELQISEMVKARPDIATIGAGVTSLAPTASQAMQTNARDMNAVIARLKKLGIDEDDIQTSRINLYAQYDYDQSTQKQVFRGYQATNQVNVILRDLDETGAVLDALVQAGATDLNGPDFSIDDDTQVKAQARKAALQRAFAQANEYAQVAGYAGVRLLEISEAITSRNPQPMNARIMMADAAEAAPTPVQPGMAGASVTISVKFEMTR